MAGKGIRAGKARNGSPGPRRRLSTGVLRRGLCEAFLVTALLLGLAGHARAQELRVEVTVEGVEGALKKNVLAHLEIEREKDNPRLTPAIIRQMHRDAPEQVRRALEPFGYYSPEVKAELRREKEGLWRARYLIDPGKPVRVRTIDIAITGEGAGETYFRHFRATPPFKAGDVFTDPAYRKAKRDLEEIARRYGYFDAKMTVHRVKVYPGEYRADITIHFDTGPRYRFGEVTFKQNILKDGFLRRFVTFAEGQPYDQRKVFDLQDALSNSGYFSLVEIRRHPGEGPDLEVPLEVVLHPGKRNKYGFGLGYGTDTGPRGTLRYENTRVNRWGHRLRAELKLSAVRNEFTTAYIIPMRNPRTDHLDFTAAYRRENPETSKYETLLGGTSFTHMRRGWFETFYLNLHYEDFEVAGESEQSFLVLPGVTWTRRKAEDRRAGVSGPYAASGYRVFLDLKGTSEYLGSDLAFAQATARGKLVYGLDSFGQVILRAEAGSTAVSDFAELPASLRFFAGGDQSIRGFAYKSLGPRNEAGEVVGGKHLLVGSFEYDQRVYKAWSVAAFVDAGNAFNAFSGEKVNVGVGGGIRWISPVGPLRLDLANAVSEPGNPWRVHVSVGPEL
ncbi:MAG: autotransporter assembly complex protein TamA [Nitrospirota bacterium]